MTNNPKPVFAGPTPAFASEPITEYDAHARRSGRAFDGWLASRMRSRAADRRRAAADRERVARRGRKYPTVDA
jgi:hypothetical protein